MEYAHKTMQLIVGKTYLVAHILVHSWQDNIDYAVPIIPHKHTDPAFFDNEHYHFDGRFAIPERVKDIIHMYDVDKGKTNAVVLTNDIWAPLVVIGGSKVFYKESECLYEFAGLHVPDDYLEKTHIPLVAWAISMKGKDCKGGKCPHYGIQMNLVDGKYICPAHNLIGCPVTEKII